MRSSRAPSYEWGACAVLGYSIRRCLVDEDLRERAMGGNPETLCHRIGQVSYEELWDLRVTQRLALIHYVRGRLVRQIQEHAAHDDRIHEARHALDPNGLTLGFARRFTAYKRPAVILSDRERLILLLSDPQRPVQLIVAGKAYPYDAEGKRLVQALAQFAAQPTLRNRVVFLEDYERALAQELVAGIDVWLNTPRRPLEASGTSGMKVLVNGGLNLSVLDGWWADAYLPKAWWALGKEEWHLDADRDAKAAPHRGGPGKFDTVFSG